MSDLRKLAEAATPGKWRSFDAFGGVSIWADGPGASGGDDLEIAHMAEERPRANAAYIAAANPHAVIGLLDERDAYRTFAVSIARMVASPGAEDTADDLEALDLGALEDVVRAEYENSHAAGDRARFARCIEDLARALGLDARRAPEWGEMVGRVRDVVRRAEMAAARWEWTHDPESMSLGLSFRGPGDVCPKSVASVCGRPERMWSVHILGQKRTDADELPAALATIRAVLGADVPEIPNERSES